MTPPKELTDDQKLIREAARLCTAGSVNRLGPAAGMKSMSAFGHVMAGNTKGLDPMAREKLTHMIVRAQVAAGLDKRFGKRGLTPAEWLERVTDHIANCHDCLLTAAIQADLHYYEVTHAARVAKKAAKKATAKKGKRS